MWQIQKFTSIIILFLTCWINPNNGDSGDNSKGNFDSGDDNYDRNSDNVDCNNHQNENSDDVEVWNSGMASAMDGEGSRWDAGYRITSIIFGVIIIVVVIMIVTITGVKKCP